MFRCPENARLRTLGQDCGMWHEVDEASSASSSTKVEEGRIPSGEGILSEELSEQESAEARLEEDAGAKKPAHIDFSIQVVCLATDEAAGYQKTHPQGSELRY